MDKSWIMEPNRLSSEYLNGVEAFLDKARNYANEEGLIRCPCVYCVNSFSHTLSTVEAHLIDRGFQQSYQIWNFHGENFPSDSDSETENDPPVFVDSDDDQVDDMIHVLNDIARMNTKVLLLSL